jgi:hypothetical protein
MLFNLNLFIFAVVNSLCFFFCFHVRTSFLLISVVAEQIIIPHFMHDHHSVYVMNKYTGTLDILDTRRYTGLAHTSRSRHHEDRVEIVRGFLFIISSFAFSLQSFLLFYVNPSVNIM